MESIYIPSVLIVAFDGDLVTGGLSGSSGLLGSLK